jgi:hypothetical protein
MLEVQAMFSLSKDCWFQCLDSLRLSCRNRLCGVMVSVLASSVVDRGFEHRSDQTKEYKIDICCFPAKHAALRSKSKDRFARNQNNVFEWRDMSTRGLLFQ